MGRHAGPVEKLSRREGVELFLKGERALNGKSALERRGDAPPGQHGRGAPRKQSIYSTQLRAKQTAKRYYGVRERQFRLYVARPPPARRGRDRRGAAAAAGAPAGQRRLPARLRRHARPGPPVRQPRPRARRRKQVDIASFLVKPGKAIAMKGRSARSPPASTELDRLVTGWLQTDLDALEGQVLRLPERTDINAPVNEQLIVELYSRLGAAHASSRRARWHLAARDCRTSPMREAAPHQPAATARHRDCAHSCRKRRARSARGGAASCRATARRR